MKARHYETWGVHLSWALPMMGDVLVITAKGEIFSTYNHIDVRHLLETGEYRNYGEAF